MGGTPAPRILISTTSSVQRGCDKCTASTANLCGDINCRSKTSQFFHISFPRNAEEKQACLLTASSLQMTTIFDKELPASLFQNGHSAGNLPENVKVSYMLAEEGAGSSKMAVLDLQPGAIATLGVWNELWNALHLPILEHLTHLKISELFTLPANTRVDDGLSEAYALLSKVRIGEAISECKSALGSLGVFRD